VHTLQTGWCRYAGQDGAKRTNVWLLTQSPRAMDLVASGQAVAGPPTPEAARPRLALPGDGFGGELPRAMSSPHQARRRTPAGAEACIAPQAIQGCGHCRHAGLRCLPAHCDCVSCSPDCGAAAPHDSVQPGYAA